MNIRSIIKSVSTTSLALFSSFLATSCQRSVSEDSAEGKGAPPGTHYVVGITNLSIDSRTEALKQLVTFLVTDIRPGDRVDLYDANSNGLDRVTTIDLPANEMYSNTRIRLKTMATQLAEVKAFLAKPRTGDKGGLPQFMRQLSHQAPFDDTGRIRRIIVIGALLYDDSREPDYSMADAWPSDAHLKGSLEQTVFSTLGVGKKISGSEVLFSDLGASPYVNDLHRDKVERFWGLFVRELGVVAVTYSAGFTSATFSGMPIEYAIDEKATRLQMVKVKARSLPSDFIDWEATPAMPVEVAVVEAAENGTPPVSPLPVAAEPLDSSMRIGLKWENPSQIDLDIYVRDPRSGTVLYYDNVADDSSGGFFVKDYTAEGAGAKNGFEAVSLPDVEAPSEVEVWVNLYRGDPVIAAIEGELRFVYRGHIHSETFSLPGGGGDRGKNADSRHNSPAWRRIELDVERLVRK